MKEQLLTGFILINKPTDWTSHDVVAYIRGIVKQKLKQDGLIAESKKIKVGHAGTLDPFATGLLIIGIGRDATKRIDEFKNMRKEYIAEIMFGAISDTYDKTGTIQQYSDTAIMKQFSIEKLINILQSFVGKQNQIPPMYSAKKVDGKKLYELARKGIEIKRKPSEIEIYKIELLNYYPTPNIHISCSAGTYIRSLIHDIGQKLDVGAYCTELQRIKIGTYTVNDAIDPKQLNTDTITQYLFHL